jgi:acyl-CoA reductase-like NAD-dependent aldehyde dehydrogenase
MSNIKVCSPFDGSLIKEIKLNNLADIDKKLAKAHRLFRDRDGWIAPYERVVVLKKLVELVKNEADDFAMLIASEGGKPLLDAKVEVARAIDGIEIAIKEISQTFKGEEIPMNMNAASKDKIAFTTYEPIGVVVAVSAFNHPLNLIVHQVIPAIAVGCPVIVKPASSTPLNCIRLVELIKEAGLPDGWCEYVVCDNEVGEKLVTDKRVGFFSFIGSGKVGWWLKSKLAPGVRCALEHGGVAPVIVDEKVDLEKIIPGIAKGGFYHAGQVCVSVQKVFVHKNIVKEFVEELAVKTQKLVVGDARDIKTEVGPLISEKEVERVSEWVREAVKEGAELVCGGSKLSDTTYQPTILLNPKESSKVSNQEIFGPVVCVYEYDDVEKVIEIANSLDVAFQAAVYSDDISFCMRVAKRLDATAVMINEHTAFRVDWMPFAGRRGSGYGIGGINYTMHDMVQKKMIVLPYC